MRPVIASFQHRRRKQIALEDMRGYFVLMELGGTILETLMSALRGADDADQVYRWASKLAQVWHRRRRQVKCARPGPCLACGREFEEGQLHWCLPFGWGESRPVELNRTKEND
ncbi:MAG: hypothetical protein V3W41_21850 [Planctomycetota bacterium]